MFEEFADGKPVTKEWPRIPYDDGDPQVRLGQAGPAQPDRDAEAVTEHFAGSGFKVFANMIASNPKVEVWAIPAKTGGSRAFCDRMNAWAQSQGQPGLGYIFWRKEGEELEGSGPLAKNIGEERTDAIRTQLGLDDGDACFFVAGDPEKFYKFAGEARTKAGERPEPGRPRPVRAVLDRRLPVLRMERGRKEGRLRPQPVLDAAGRPRGAEEPGSADDQGLPVRRRLQRLRNRLGLDP